MKISPPTGMTQPLMIIGLLVFVFFSGFFQVSDVDVGYHLRTGAYILSGHGIPTTNTFSAATPEYPWLLQQWLGAIFFYLAFALGGVKSLIVIKALVAVFIMFLAWRCARAETGPESWWPFWVVTAGAVATRMRFFERPDLLSALFFALLLYLDKRWNRKRSWQWLGLPLLMASWANTHAGVLYGFVLLGAISGTEWLEWLWNKRIRRRSTLSESKPNGSTGMKSVFIRPAGILLSLGAACLTVQLINPNGCRVLWVPITQFASPFWQSIIDEYHSPTWAGAKPFYCFLAGLIILQIGTRKSVNWRLLLVSATFGFLACRSQRSILFFIIAAVPHAARMLEILLPHSGKDIPVDTESHPVAAAAVPSAGKSIISKVGWRPGVWQWIQPVLLLTAWILTIGLLFLPDQTFRFGVGWYRPYYPLEIYRLIQKEVPPQNIFNEMRYGGSMMWWLYPRFRPFIDGRGDAYSVEFWQQEYLPVLDAKPVWRQVFAKYGIHGVLLPVTGPGKVSPLAKTLFADPQWALVAFNDDTLFFLERTETNNQVVAAHQFKLLWPGNWSFDRLDVPGTHLEAADEARRAFESAPDSLFAQTAMARLFMTSGQFNEAADLLGRILRENPVSEAYWRDYGFSLFKLARYDEADQVFSRMIRKNQLAGFAYFMRHFIALEHHDPAAAGRFLSRALEIEPDNAEYRAARNRLDASHETTP